jgi:hypothetical protein
VLVVSGGVPFSLVLCLVVPARSLNVFQKLSNSFGSSKGFAMEEYLFCIREFFASASGIANKSSALALVANTKYTGLS